MRVFYGVVRYAINALSMFLNYSVDQSIYHVETNLSRYVQNTSLDKVKFLPTIN